MSLLRLTTRRPLAALCGAPARAFSTSCARNQESTDSTRDLYNTLISSEDRQKARVNRREDFTRSSQSEVRNPAALGAGAPSSNHAYARKMLQENHLANPSSVNEELESASLRADLETQMPRRWEVGNVYAPHDLSGVEARKWRRQRKTPTTDAFETLAINPLKEYKNFSIMSEYMTEMGRIKHSKVTGLKPKNQRKMAKAIRRAIGIGIMPSVHIHPELIKPSHGAPVGGGRGDY